jgi:hypothetical protein
MKNTRWIVVAGGVLAIGILVVWFLSSLFPLGLDPEIVATEQGDVQIDLGEATWEPDVYGAIRLVDPDHQRITLAIGAVDGLEQEKTYILAKDAEVVVNGHGISNKLANRIRVRLVFGPDSKEAAAIRSEAFQITIEPRRQDVEIGKPFDMVLRITNGTETPQPFWVMLTSFCNNTLPIPVKLAPGEVYERTIAIEVTRLDFVFFKIGFIPHTDNSTDVLNQRTNGYGEVRRKLNPGERTYWSCEVIVEVE